MTQKSGRSFQTVLGYDAALWWRRPGMVAATAAAILVATGAELAIPVFAGRLIDAVAEPDRHAGRAARIAATW